MVLKGMNDRTTVVNVSVTVLFSPEVFYGAMLRSYNFGPQILAAYLIRVIFDLTLLTVHFDVFNTAIRLVHEE